MLGDGEDFSLFSSDDLEEVGRVSDADPAPLAAAKDLPSPGLSYEAVSPFAPSPFLPSFHTSMYLAGEGLESVPPDFEIRESDVSKGTLGVWARRHLEVGERLGPYEGPLRHRPESATQAWEVSVLTPQRCHHEGFFLLCVSVMLAQRSALIVVAGQDELSSRANDMHALSGDKKAFVGDFVWGKGLEGLGMVRQGQPPCMLCLEMKFKPKGEKRRSFKNIFHATIKSSIDSNRRLTIELATLARFFTQMEMCAVTWPSPLTICCPIIHKQPAGPANRPVALPVGTVTDGSSLKEGRRARDKSGGVKERMKRADLLPDIISSQTLLTAEESSLNSLHGDELNVGFNSDRAIYIPYTHTLSLKKRLVSLLQDGEKKEVDELHLICYRERRRELGVSELLSLLDTV
ncbi:Zinc finger protein 16 [Triplophysa tibetana]|uniref:Zinc finger protein 16 n=1 Tax=Triplophysa tibetana TaxID=1572043 RepID=A0A5A9MWD9_9TELE|nr:Zinc finger protein 16 [Triplophysa tibetana]